MTPVRTLVLDNEAVQALADPSHRKHRPALAHLEVVVTRNLRRNSRASACVPTSVRVEAGWSRQDQSAPGINRLRIRDDPLDGPAADRAAAVRTALNVSVADAHIASVLRSTPGPHAVLTSDADDLSRIAEHLGIQVNIVQL